MHWLTVHLILTLITYSLSGQATAQSRYDLVNAAESGDSLRGTLVSRSTASPELGPDLLYLKLDAIGRGSDTIHIKITDPSSTRWEVPLTLYPSSNNHKGGGAANATLKLEWAPSPFSISAKREEEKEKSGPPLFSTLGHELIFKDQYLQLTTSVPEDAVIYGLGERTSSSGLPLLRNMSYTMWNRDRPSLFPDENLYGSHPFIMIVQPDGSTHGILLFSSNAMDVNVSHDAVQYRVVGGMLDVYCFAGPTPDLVMEQYTRVIGRPTVPPFWSLGFHQCKYGYKSLAEVAAVVENYTAAEIPLEAIWTDIDYMSGFRDFTFNEDRWPQKPFKEWVQKLHDSNIAWVPIVDPGIMVDPEYDAYNKGLAADIFIKEGSGEPYKGQVWPGPTHWPDFIHPDTQDYWQQQLEAFHDLAAFDGLWIDMNEASNFIEDPIAPSDGKRPFALTRSTFLGSGQYVSHWTGDNAATWNDLRWSVSSILSSGLHGIPHVGADICGFTGFTTEELCNRWILLGAFYPFARDHSDFNWGYQELYRWPSVQEAGKKALGLRYRLLPHMYTAFQRAHEQGTPVARPLFYHWPADEHAHKAHGQFLLGHDILITPVLTEGATNVTGYFPQGVWHALWNGSADIDASKGGKHQTLNTPLGETNVHVRGGSVLSMQEAALTTAAVRASPLSLLVALPSLEELQALEGRHMHQAQLIAEGSLYVDDGVTLEDKWHMLHFAAYQVESAEGISGFLQIRGPAEQGNRGCSEVNHTLASVQVRGWQHPVSLVQVHAHQPPLAEHQVLTRAVELPSPRALQWQHQGSDLTVSGIDAHLSCSSSVSVEWGSGTAYA
ncbi:hypothetical protein WJX73_006346 [Symbiochloris irregularis]|uniref:alpha-glucosidase n=1 Tax=Symbiochloris irregularis TaxID=706552 RepID=A0AAW1P4X5_9CHLO